MRKFIQISIGLLIVNSAFAAKTCEIYVKSKFSDKLNVSPYFAEVLKKKNFQLVKEKTNNSIVLSFEPYVGHPGISIDDCQCDTSYIDNRDTYQERDTVACSYDHYKYSAKTLIDSLTGLEINDSIDVYQDDREEYTYSVVYLDRYEREINRVPRTDTKHIGTICKGTIKAQKIVWEAGMNFPNGFHQFKGRKFEERSQVPDPMRKMHQDELGAAKSSKKYESLKKKFSRYNYKDVPKRNALEDFVMSLEKCKDY